MSGNHRDYDPRHDAQNRTTLKPASGADSDLKREWLAEQDLRTGRRAGCAAVMILALIPALALARVIGWRN